MATTPNCWQCGAPPAGPPLRPADVGNLSGHIPAGTTPVLVRFVVAGCSPYQVGEVAGFPAHVARRLIAAGLANVVLDLETEEEP